jgi:hypothetical protein
MTITAELPQGYGIPTANKFTLPNIGKLVAKIISSHSDNDEVPTQHLLDALQESEEDYKAGRYKSFKTAQEAHNYLDQIINGKKNK